MFQKDLLFQGAHSTGWLLLCVASVVAAGVLMATLLRYERRLVSPRVGWTLLGLRLAVLAVLFLTFLQPILTWTVDRKKTGRVMIAVDLSESMETTDDHASRADKLRWARGLGMIGNATIADRLDRWTRELDDGREPSWTDASEAADDERRSQMEDARKETLQGIFAEIDRLPRKEIARRLLAKGAVPLIEELEKQGTVELVVFAGRSETADAGTLEGTVNRPPASVLSESSDLAAALSAVPASSDESPLLGIIVLTDGRDNAGRDPLGLASRMGTLNTPVFPVMLGSTTRPKDLAIASVEHPASAFKDDKPMLKATISTPGFEGEDVTVVLERPDHESVTRTVRATGRSFPVEFELDATKVGRQEYTIRTELQEDETRDDNNSRPFAFTVVDDKVRVLLLEGEARWEFRFIDNALSRDERVLLRKVVYRQPYMGVLGETFFPRTLPMPAKAENLADSPFAEPDLVILGDISPNDLPQAGWELLEKYVSEGGGTLVMIAGKQFLPLAYLNNPIIERLVPLSAMRQVNMQGPEGLGSPTDRGFRLKLTPEGEREGMLQFDGDPVENRRIWDGLPGHVWGLIGQAKPAATIYAWAQQPGMPAGLDAERNSAVIVQQSYGFGQVLWMGIDSTWRWRHRVGDRYHHRFWGQLGRWAAENKAAAGNENVKFGADKVDVQIGEDVNLKARFSQPFVRRFPDLKARAELTRADAEPNEKPFAVVDLKPQEGRPLVYEGRVVGLPGGSWKARLVTDSADVGSDSIVAGVFVNKPQTLELSDLSANRELLQQIANVSHGRLFTADQLAELPPLLRHPDLVSTTREDYELWNHWTVMLAFFALLTMEWVVRKLNGLP